MDVLRAEMVSGRKKLLHGLGVVHGPVELDPGSARRWWVGRRRNARPLTRDCSASLVAWLVLVDADNQGAARFGCGDAPQDSEDEKGYQCPGSSPRSS